MEDEKMCQCFSCCMRDSGRPQFLLSHNFSRNTVEGTVLKGFRVMW